MKRPILLLLCAGLAFGLAGYPDAGAESYPMEIVGVGDSADYPLRAAGFERNKMFRYEPGDADISVGYHILTPEQRIASDIYISDASVFPGLLQQADPLAALFGGTKASVEQYREGARLLSESRETLTKNGRDYTALAAAYTYESEFLSERQIVYSFVMVWRHGDKFIKLRSTAPIDQGKLVLPRNLELLDALNWTKTPG